MRGLVFVVMLSLFPVAVRAAERPTIGPPPAWVIAASIPVPTAGTAEIAATVLLADRQTRLTSSGDARFVETAVHIGSSQGLQAGGLALAWDPALETLTIHKYRIVRDGKTIDLLGDGSKLIIVRRETNLERATLDGQLTATMQPEDVRVGDTIDVAYTQTRRDPALAGRSQAVFGIAPGANVSYLRVRVLWPADKPAHWQASPGVLVPTERRMGGEREMLAEVRDATGARPPKGAPLRYQFVNLVAVSDMGSWSDVSRLMAPLFARAAAAAQAGAVRAEAARIASASPDPKVRALAALRLVQEQVRYVLLSIDDGGYVPAQADTTWSRRFGDCKGKTALLLALLRELGIDARPALVSVQAGDGLDRRLPMAGAFDHVIVQAQIAGRTYWLDGTRPGDRVLDAIRTPEFHWALPVSAKGEALVALVPDPMRAPHDSITLDLDASKGLDVPATATGEIRLTGDGAMAMRVTLLSNVAAERDRVMRELWHGNYDFVTADAVSAEDDAATGAFTMRMRGTARVKWETNGYRYYWLDGGTLGRTLDTARDPGPGADAPFAVPFPSWSETRETIVLPNGGKAFKLDGGAIDRTIGAYRFRREVTLAQGKVTMVASTRTLAPEMPFAGIAAIKAELAKLAERGVSIDAPGDYRPTDAEVAALRATTPASAQGFLDRGQVLFDREDYAAALKDYDAAIALDAASASASASARAHAMRALSLAWLRDARSEAASARALALDAKEFRAWNARGIVADFGGRRVEAEAAYTQSLALSHNETWPLVQRAKDRALLGRYPEGLADMDAASKLAPDSTWVLDSRVGLSMANGHPDDALASVSAFAKAHPDDLDARWRQAGLLGETGRKTEAAGVMNALVAAHPKDEEVLWTRARMRQRMGDRDGSFADYAMMIARRPDAYMLLERAQMWMPDDREHWQADLDRADKLRPGDVSVALARAVVTARAGDYRAAEAALARAEKGEPSHPQIVSIRADILRREGRREEAIALAEAKMRKELPSSGALNNLCWEKAISNVRLTSALADCEAALKLAPGNAAALDSRAFVKLRLGRIGEAIADYDAALNLRPYQAGSLYGRGLAKLRAGQDGSADLAAARKSNTRIDSEYAGYGMAAPAPATPR